jgi:FMN-dependent NADH-azoreductase
MSDIWSITSPKDKHLQPYNSQHMKIVEIDEKVTHSAHLQQQDVGANTKVNRIMGSSMKTLIVKYIPRNQQSNTKKLLDAFREEISISDVEELDLLDDVPDMLFDNNLLAHLNRNILGLELLPDEEKLLSKMDRMATQLKSADIVVVAFPMYNFSMPAIVKAWFDSVIQKGITFGEGTSNDGKKALTLISSGGLYNNKSSSGREHALSLSNLEFQYMGYSDVRGILAEGMAMNEEIKETNLSKSIRQVRAIAREWYKKGEYDSMCVNLISKKRRFGNV